MSKENGFVPLRRGIWEHVRDGRMSLTEVAAFIYICSQADTRTGVWNGSAGALTGELGIPSRTARDVLEKMEHGDYIRRFAVPGRHVCYPILVHKFPISQGEHNGEQLNALESKSSIELSYLPREHNGEHGVEHGAAQRIQETRDRRQRQHLAAKPAPPADPRFKLFFDGAYQAYRSKNGQPPTWKGREGTNLGRFLKDNQWVTPEEWEKRFTAYLASTDRYTGNKGDDSLLYFVLHFDLYINGPVLEKKTGSNNGNRTMSTEERNRETDANAARFLENNCGVAANLRPSAVPAKPDPKAVN